MSGPYSVAIRTLGTAGESYQKLLDSIQKQTLQPEKVVVVLPEGYELPEHRSGREEFVFSEKGMMPQRLGALEHIHSEFTLFCDDDVELEAAFAEKVLDTLKTGRYDCGSGPLLEVLPQADLRHRAASVLGGACVMLHGRGKTYVRLLRTGGWSYNRSIAVGRHKVYETESLPGACFLARTEAMRRIQLEKELWAEKTGYAAFEDRIMLGKLTVNGYRSCVISDARYVHHDEKTGTRQLKAEPVYAAAYNHYVFWHRYIYSPEKSLLKRGWARLCVGYYVTMSRLYHKIKYRRARQLYQAVRAGFADASAFVKSGAYAALGSAVVLGNEGKAR